MPTTEFTGDDRPALNYIKERGYASYSSIKNVRDCVVPSSYSSNAQNDGKELHARYLEGIINLQEPAVEKMLVGMLASLAKDQIAKRLTANSKNEIDFGPKKALAKYNSKSPLIVPSIYGLPIYGRIDILNYPNNAADLKSTKLTSKKAFIESMDFLQAAIYLAATKCKNFYYIGISKQKPYPVMIFNVRQYPDRLAEAEVELKRLCKYITKNI